MLSYELKCKIFLFLARVIDTNLRPWFFSLVYEQFQRRSFKLSYKSLFTNFMSTSSGTHIFLRSKIIQDQNELYQKRIQESQNHTSHFGVGQQR